MAPKKAASGYTIVNLETHGSVWRFPEHRLEKTHLTSTLSSNTADLKHI